MYDHCSLPTTCWIVRPHTTVLFLFVHVLRTVILVPGFHLSPPSWAASSLGHKRYLELARGLTYTLHAAPPPRDEGVNVLVSRPLKGTSSEVNISSLLVNVRGRHIVLVPIFFSKCFLVQTQFLAVLVPAVKARPRCIRCSSVMLLVFVHPCLVLVHLVLASSIVITSRVSHTSSWSV